VTKPILIASLLIAVVLALQSPIASSDTPAAGASDAVLADGRALTGQFLAGDVEPIWARFGEPLRAAIGSAAGFKAFSAQVNGQLGAETSVLREDVELNGGIAAYRRVGRWSGVPMPIVITWAIAPGGRIEGFQVAPASPAELGGPSLPQSSLPPGKLPDNVVVAERIQALVAEPGAAPGVAVALLDRDGPRFVAWGDAGDGRPPDADTVFEAGSITKGLTGLLLAQMIAAGEVAPEQPISGLMPARFELSAEAGAITLEELATHTSGLPRLAAGPEMQARTTSSDPYAGSTPEEIFADVARVTSATISAGRGRYAYSNLGSALLGQLLAQAAAQPFEVLLAERVFGPLELATPVFNPDAVAGRRASGAHAGQPVPVWHFDAYAPMGAWQASARDLLALGERLLRDEPAWVADALRRRDIVGHPGGGVGLAWHVAQIGDREVIWHNGGTAGSSSHLAVVPAEGLVVAVLANGGGGVVDGVARALVASGR
jgi:CubicO group peptidase (beta-lactamase class C family)